MSNDQRHQAESKTPTVESTWRSGPRTETWKTLWRRMLADVHLPIQPTALPQQADESIDDSPGAASAHPAPAAREANGDGSADNPDPCPVRRATARGPPLAALPSV